MASRHNTTVELEKRKIKELFSKYSFDDLTRDEIRFITQHYDQFIDRMLNMQHNYFAIFVSLILWHKMNKKLCMLQTFLEKDENIVDILCKGYKIKKSEPMFREIGVIVLFLNDKDNRNDLK